MQKELAYLKGLAKLVDEYGLSGLEVQQGEDRIVLRKEQTAQAPQPVPVASVAVPAQPAAGPTGGGGPDENNENLVKSPLVGCVYLAAAPDAPAFAAPGTPVKQGQTLCIIEAMKLMNELPAPRDGVVAEVLVSNEEMVEYGQPLFRLQ